MERHDAALDALFRAALDAPGDTARSLRESALDGTGVPEPWSAYVARVRDASHVVGDSDIAALRGAGFSEDAILEVTVAAALGAAKHRRDAALRAMRAASG